MLADEMRPLASTTMRGAMTVGTATNGATSGSSRNVDDSSAGTLRDGSTATTRPVSVFPCDTDIVTSVMSLAPTTTDVRAQSAGSLANGGAAGLAGPPLRPGTGGGG